MYHSEFHIERIEGLPDEVYLHILKDIHDQRQIRLQDRIKHQNELKLINDEYQNEIHSLIGKENLPTYLRLHKRRMKGMSNLRKAIPKSRDGLIKFEKKRHYNIRETKKLLKKAGIDENTLRALQKTHSEKIKNANKKLILAEVKSQAVGLKIIDSDAAYSLMEKNDIEVDDDGNVTGVKESLEKLIENKKYLVKGSTDNDNKNVGDDQQGKGNKGTSLDMNALIRKSAGY